jgi:hypothetical protein
MAGIIIWKETLITGLLKFEPVNDTLSEWLYALMFSTQRKAEDILQSA